MERRTTFGLAIRLLLVACLERSHQSSDESRLLNDLFSRPGYNPSARPVANENDTLEISFGAALQQIVKVDELNEAIHLNMWWQIQWLDYNLAWNASDYGNVKSLRVSPNRIWIPDVTLYNRVEFGDTTEQSNVIVSSDGTCFWIPLGVYVSQCSIDIQWFPFDDQTCNLNFESWTYDITKINMTLMRKTLNMNHYKNSAQWEIVGTPGHRIEVTYDSGTYTTIIFKIHIRRKAMFFGFNLIMPCILISVLSLTVFGLPPNCGERIGLSVSILVALSVYQVIILDRIPASGDTVPLLGIYFGSVQATGILLTAISVFIVNLENRRSPIYTMPNWVRIWICGRLARLLRLPASENKSWRPQHELNSVDPHMSNQSKSEHLSDIVKIIAKKKEEKENEKLELDQWRFTAYVLDRFCSYLFSVLFVGGTMIMLAVPVFRSKNFI